MSTPEGQETIAEQPAPAERGRTAPPLMLPRGLIFLSFGWLVAGWIHSMGFGLPLSVSPASFEPAVRNMALWLMVGLTVGWPLYRLSQGRSPWPARQTMLDLVVMLSIVQVVVWPLRLVTTWPPLRVLAIDLSLIAWAAVIGAIITVAISAKRPGARTLAMLACIAIVLAGPAIAWLAARVGLDVLHLIDRSPVMQVRTLGTAGARDPSLSDWLEISVVLVAAMTAWTILIIRQIILPSTGIEAGERVC